MNFDEILTQLENLTIAPSSDDLGNMKRALGVLDKLERDNDKASRAGFDTGTNAERIQSARERITRILREYS